jgi:Mn2+/Fe2+ NRAMP family transporter
VLGTTISPYLFFWQGSQEVEEVRNNRGEKPLKRALLQAEEQLGRIRIDTYLGMAFSNLVAFFIILTAAATLHTHGITQISTSAQAATALEPLAGRFAFLLFVCGTVGTGLLAVPLLAALACYGVGEAWRWKTSLERKPGEAVRFYAAITVATLTGLSLNFLHIDPVKALFWAAIRHRRRAVDGGHHDDGLKPKSNGKTGHSGVPEMGGLACHRSGAMCLYRRLLRVEIELPAHILRI